MRCILNDSVYSALVKVYMLDTPSYLAGMSVIKEKKRKTQYTVYRSECKSELLVSISSDKNIIDLKPMIGRRMKNRYGNINKQGKVFKNASFHTKITSHLFREFSLYQTMQCRYG